jgi:PIN domain nuclease of toxin-antitoxin system
VACPASSPTPKIAARAYTLSGLSHADLAARMLIATAIAHGCPLITCDERIITFATSHGSRYGFTVES